MKKYFLADANLYGIVVLYDYPMNSSLSSEYLLSIENVVAELSFEFPVVLQWIRIDVDSRNNEEDTKKLLHQHIETGCQVRPKKIIE